MVVIAASAASASRCERLDEFKEQLTMTTIGCEVMNQRVYAPSREESLLRITAKATHQFDLPQLMLVESLDWGRLL